MAGSQKDTAGRLAYTDEMAGSRRAHDAILTDQELLDAIRSTNLGDDLGNLWVPEATITADDEERALDALGDGLEDAGDKGLGVVWLLEDLDLLAQTRAIAS